MPINVSTPCIGAVLDSTVAYAENMDSQKINHSSTENTDELDNDIEIVTFEEVDQATQTSCYDVPEKTNYSCPTCQRKFTLTSNLNRHVEEVHLKRLVYKCRLCNKSFLSGYVEWIDMRVFF